MESQRQAVAVDHHHPLGALPLLGEPHLVSTVLRRCEGAVKESLGPIELTPPVECRQRRPPNALPDALLTPPLEAPPNGCRRAVLARQVLPAAASDEDVQDALNGPAIVGARSPCARWRW